MSCNRRELEQTVQPVLMMAPRCIPIQTLCPKQSRGSVACLDGAEELLLGEALLDGAVQLAHQPLTWAHMQHDVTAAHLQPLRSTNVLMDIILY